MKTTKTSSWIGVSILFLPFTSMLGSNKSNQRPNIIILTADDLGWNDISSSATTLNNGSRYHQTPNIDRFATQGMSFTQAYTQQNSAPTRASLLTGLYASHTHVYNVWGLDRYSKPGTAGITKEQARIVPANQQSESISPSTITFAEVLRKANYENYIFGKVHGWKGDLEKDHGFNHDYSCEKDIKKIPGSNYYAAKTEKGWIFSNPKYNRYAQPYSEEYIRKNLLPFANGNNPLTLVGTKKHFTDAIGDCVVDQLSQVDQSKPFCFWVCFHAIHSAIVGRNDLYDKYKNLPQSDERHTNYKYAALTEQLDQTVGRILAALEDPNGDGDKSDSMADNTFVIFSSDNGGVHGGNHSNAPLRWAKGTQYEGGIRVPLMIRYPQLIAPGTICNEPVHVIDYLPTLAQLAGIKLKHPVDGISMMPLLTGKSKTLSRDAFYWHFPGYMDERSEPNTTIIKKIGDTQYKLRYFYENDRAELYCLSSDLSEKTNLLENDTTGKYTKIGNMLLEDMRKWINQTKPLPMTYKDSGKPVVLPREIHSKNQ